MTDDSDAIIRDLERITQPAPREAGRLASAAGRGGQREGVLDIAYRVIDSPVGRSCWPPRNTDCCASPTSARTTTRCWRNWPKKR